MESLRHDLLHYRTILIYILGDYPAAEAPEGEFCQYEFMLVVHYMYNSFTQTKSDGTMSECWNT